MKKQPWTPREVTFLIQQRANNASAPSIAKALGRSLASINDKVRHLISDGQVSKLSGAQCRKTIDIVSQFVVPEEPKFDGYLRLEGDFISVSDVHVPFWKVELFEKLFLVAEKFKIPRLIINGDFLNMDAFSHYTGGFKGLDNMEKEFTKADYVLAKCLNVFKEVVITMGNHEERLFKQLLGQVNPERFFRMLHTEIGKRVKVSNYPYCFVGDKWLVGHPRNYSDRGGTTPADLADVFNRNVICGHNHQFGVQTSKNGKHIGIDQGCACDPLKVEYNMKSLTKFRRWQNGFTMVRNNAPYLFNLKFTDWEFWTK